MAKISLVDTFSLVPEGWHNFRIEEAEYKEQFNKIVIKLKSDKGYTHTENYNLAYEGALKAFSYLAKVATQDPTNRDIDPKDLEGKYLLMEIVHTSSPSTTTPGETVTFANSRGKKESNGFSNEQDVDKMLGLK